MVVTESHLPERGDSVRYMLKELQMRYHVPLAAFDNEDCHDRVSIVTTQDYIRMRRVEGLPQLPPCGSGGASIHGPPGEVAYCKVECPAEVNICTDKA
jgi:hypothetical protein